MFYLNGNLSEDGTNSYRYNSENELERADAGGVTTRYGYDGLGMRVRKDVGGTVTYYIHDGAQVIAEYDGAGNLSAEYLYGPGIDEPLVMERSGNAYYYLADRLGSISALTDSSGNIVESYEYSAFGEFTKVIGAGNDIGNPYYFTGRRRDGESGTYYYRHRQYDAKLGRFLQRDPLGESSDPNLYRYVYNSPGNATDPMGLVPIWGNSGARHLNRQTISGVFPTTFTYDGDGGRVKEVNGNGTRIYVGNLFDINEEGVRTNYLYAGSQLVASYTANPAPGEPNTKWYHGDHLGSSTVITDELGDLVDEYYYRPYGATALAERNDIGHETAHGFTGQRRDAGTGFYFYNARYYDPQIGRFLTADTIVPDYLNPQSLNRYSYVLNNPLYYTVSLPQ